MRCSPTTTVNQTDGVLLARPHALLDMAEPMRRFVWTVVILLRQILAQLLRRVLLVGRTLEILLLGEVPQITLS